MTKLFNIISGSLKHWYIPLVTGIIFILLGIYIFTVPLETYLTLSYLFSISFIVSGVLEILFSIQNRSLLSGWGWYLTSGLLTFGIGIYLIANPEISIATLPFVAGFTLLFRSAYGLGFSFDLKEYGVIEWGNIAILSVIGIIVSFLLLFNPLFTGVSLIVITGLAFITTGTVAILLSFRLKKLKDLPQKISANIKAKLGAIKTEYEQALKK